MGRIEGNVQDAPISHGGDDYMLQDDSRGGGGVRPCPRPPVGERWQQGKGYGWMSSERSRGTSSYDLVEQAYYLYVRVVKLKDIPASPVTGSCDPYVEVRLGNYKGRTQQHESSSRRRIPAAEWNQVFAFSKDRIQASVLEVFVKDKETMLGRDDLMGRVVFDLNEVPTRVPPDSPLAPQWYCLDHPRGGQTAKGEVMLAVWMGTQADEAFPEAFHSDTVGVAAGVPSVRSKVYMAPKLWYLRVNVIEAQDVVPKDRSRSPELFIKVQVGGQVLRTKPCQPPPHNYHPNNNNGNNATALIWDEDLVFVVAEPFEEQMILTVEDRVHSSKDDILGTLALPVDSFEKRLDHVRAVQSRWFNLNKFGGFGVLEPDRRRRDLKFASRVHITGCLEGGYHVLDESTMYISHQQPTSRQLWKPPVGFLEVGILSAQGLLPMKTTTRDTLGRTDSYCVAKYGQKWVRTRTMLDTLNPKWNEQYTWEVFDPCSVVTLAVFDNCNLGGAEEVKKDRDGACARARDSRIGKVRIRLSTLGSNRVYANSFPLLVMDYPSGLKKMGELKLTVRFTSLSLTNMLYMYGRPLLPKMHYLQPLTVNQIDSLRYQAMSIVATRLERAEPPLRKEVVEFMLDVDSHLWSMRRSKVNFFRVMSLLSGAISVTRWFRDMCEWRNPVTTALVHVLLLILVWYPELILPTLCLYLFLIGLWNYRHRPRNPPLMDSRLSWAEVVHPDELDEEFDTFPTSRSHEVVRMRYDRLRSIASRIQTMVGDISMQGERLQSLLSWRDSRATSLFILFCLFMALVLYATPFRVVALVSGLYTLRHPRFQSKLPCVPINFFRRLPSQSDSLL